MLLASLTLPKSIEKEEALPEDEKLAKAEFEGWKKVRVLSSDRFGYDSI